MTAARASAAHLPELSVVMPAYCEERRIADTVSIWMAEFDRLHIDYEFLIYDDGSKDGTRQVLERLSIGRPRLVVKSHANRGHGPTILIGYREARGEWVFQTDSDGELPASQFGVLWSHREQFDFLVGYRQQRHSTFARRIVTTGSRLAVRCLFGSSVRDVNSPYRLMRRSSLARMLRLVPATTFAPNVILSGLAARLRLRMYETPVPHAGQRTVTVALNKWKLWKTAGRCLRQTVVVALATARESGR